MTSFRIFRAVLHGIRGERIVVRAQHPVLDKAIESLQVWLRRHTRYEVLGPTLKHALKQRLTFLVSVPALQEVYDSNMVQIVAAL